MNPNFSAKTQLWLTLSQSVTYHVRKFGAFRKHRSIDKTFFSNFMSTSFPSHQGVISALLRREDLPCRVLLRGA